MTSVTQTFGLYVTMTLVRVELEKNFTSPSFPGVRRAF
jgi:hypothetical protein